MGHLLDFTETRYIEIVGLYITGCVEILESYETYLLLFELTVFTLKPTKLLEDIVVRKTILCKTDKKVK